MPQVPNKTTDWWASTAEENLNDNHSSADGLGSKDAYSRLKTYGRNTLSEHIKSKPFSLLIRQLSSPIVIILIAAAFLSFTLRDPTNGIIILTIISVSSLLGFWQEYRAAVAVEKLQNMVEVLADVMRDKVSKKIPIDEVVAGDVVLLSAGSGVPADSRLLELRDLFVNEATLTGETFPVEKIIGILPAETQLAKRTNAVFKGTHVVSGTAKAVVMRTGKNTQFGLVAHRLRLQPPETDFERGVRNFGNLIIRITLVLTILIFGLNVFLAKPVLESFLFALALAVGLTPELLPAIISVNLATGARRMVAKKVIVKRLVSIENFGSMDLLCSDKTGTLTEGKVQLDAHFDPSGKPSDRTLRFAAINASFQTGFRNPMDDAIKAVTSAIKLNAVPLDEIPYDFSRKRLSIFANIDGQNILVTKGAFTQVLDVCNTVELSLGKTLPLSEWEDPIRRQFAEFSARGLRTLAIAIKALPDRTTINRQDEVDLTFLGFLLFADPPKAGITATIKDLKSLGVALKVITGDNRLVAAEISRQVGFHEPRIVSGTELRHVSDDALPLLATSTDIFAEVEPNQKERVILALRKAGHVVGYLGDGINDASALRAADVGLSVQGAADVAKDAADIVLLDPDLAVLVAGIREGRKTFTNTMKYVFMAASANFGNMFSMAGASLLLPFLPLMPKQILLINLITDLPEMAIATDFVEEEAIQRPQHWDITYILKFMLRFGLISSIFDFATFAVLHYALKASPEMFRTGWFVESVVSASLVVLVIRTRGPFWKNRPSSPLLWSTVGVVVLALAIPYTPLGTIFGFVPLPAMFLALMGLIVLMYVVSAEMLKIQFFKSRATRSFTVGGSA